jgi:hypothetical protein
MPDDPKLDTGGEFGAHGWRQSLGRLAGCEAIPRFNGSARLIRTEVF